MPTRPIAQTLACSLLALSLGLTLSSCGTAPTKPTSEQRQVQSPGAQARALLEQAQRAQSPQREALLLQATGFYIQAQKYERARDLLNSLEPDHLSDINFFSYIELKAKVALQEGEISEALGILTNPRLEQQWGLMNPSSEARLREQRAQTFELAGNFELSLAERFSLASLLNNAQQAQDNQQWLWRDLMQIKPERLAQLAGQAPNDLQRGWYSLAVIAQDNQLDLEQQQTNLEAWEQQWPNHPARANLPENLRLLRSLIDQQPRQVALLLPLQGKLQEAGQAVSDGFFAAYYQAQAKGRHLPEVRQYDSTGDIVAAYQKAVADGAQLVIGPLDKDKVNELSLLNSFPAPLLTLNYAELPPAARVPNFYQFGLAVEDEARQVARRAFADGNRQAMVLIPEQEWSQRSARAFEEEWNKLGGTVVSHSQFKPGSNYSNLVKAALLIDESRERANEMRGLLGKLEFTPRSRSDVDMIFLIANPAQARQIKPTFAFHFAGKIPVYATSQVYSGEANPKADRDLTGVRFDTMPWLFDNSSPEKLAVRSASKTAAVYDRLQALGVDAFRLYARLPQLAQAEQMRLYGTTGALHMQPDGRIEREQLWARFRDGYAQPLPMVVDADEAAPETAP